MKIVFKPYTFQPVITSLTLSYTLCVHGMSFPYSSHTYVPNHTLLHSETMDICPPPQTLLFSSFPPPHNRLETAKKSLKNWNQPDHFFYYSYSQNFITQAQKYYFFVPKLKPKLSVLNMWQSFCL